MNNLIFFILVLFVVIIIINLYNNNEFFNQTNSINNSDINNMLITNTNSDQYYLDYSNNNLTNSTNSNTNIDYSNINSDDNVYPYYNFYLDQYETKNKDDIFSFNPKNVYWNPKTANFKNYFYIADGNNKKYASLNKITEDAFLYSPSVSQHIICSNYKNQANCWENNKCQWTKPPGNHCEVATTMLL